MGLYGDSKVRPLNRTFKAQLISQMVKKPQVKMNLKYFNQDKELRNYLSQKVLKILNFVKSDQKLQ